MEKCLLYVTGADCWLYKLGLCLSVSRKMYIVKFVCYLVHKGQQPFSILTGQACRGIQDLMNTVVKIWGVTPCSLMGFAWVLPDFTLVSADLQLWNVFADTCFRYKIICIS